MISQLTGTLLERTPTSVVLDVAGIGYELGVSQTTLASLPETGTPSVCLFARLRLSEQAVTLYGFSTKEERAVFDKLVTVAGVGPKVALAVLSTFTPQMLAEVVAAQDEARMQSVSGVGKKMAGRLLLELKGLFAADENLQKLAGALDISDGLVEGSTASAFEETKDALLGLGYAPQEVQAAIASLQKKTKDEDRGALTVEQLLRDALRLLGGSHVGSR